MLSPSFGVFLGAPTSVRIWFDASIAGYIQEKIWHNNQMIQALKDGSIIFEAEVVGTDEIKFWILSWGSKAVVLEPDSLREEIRSETLAIIEIYDRMGNEGGCRFTQIIRSCYGFLTNHIEASITTQELTGSRGKSESAQSRFFTFNTEQVCEYGLRIRIPGGVISLKL